MKRNKKLSTSRDYTFFFDRIDSMRNKGEASIQQKV